MPEDQTLMLEILKNLQAGLARIDTRLQENTARLVELADEVRHLGRGRTLDQDHMARLQVDMDTLRRDVDRINVRLGIAD